MSLRLYETPSAAAAALGRRAAEMRTPGQPRARAAIEARGFADDEVRPRSADGASETPDAEPGVGDDDDGADPEARVDDGRERRSRLNEERYAVALADADPMQAGREALHPVVELPPGHSPRGSGSSG